MAGKEAKIGAETLLSPLRKLVSEIIHGEEGFIPLVVQDPGILSRIVDIKSNAQVDYITGIVEPQQSVVINPKEIITDLKRQLIEKENTIYKLKEQLQRMMSTEEKNKIILEYLGEVKSQDKIKGYVNRIIGDEVHVILQSKDEKEERIFPKNSLGSKGLLYEGARIEFIVEERSHKNLYWLQKDLNPPKRKITAESIKDLDELKQVASKETYFKL